MSSAASCAVRAIGPTVSSEALIGMTPSVLTCPRAGRTPVSPHSAEGTRTEPPVSVPSAPAHSPAATAAADPPLDPPGLRSRFQGLRAGP